MAPAIPEYANYVYRARPLPAGFDWESDLGQLASASNGAWCSLGRLKQAFDETEALPGVAPEVRQQHRRIAASLAALVADALRMGLFEARLDAAPAAGTVAPAAR